MKLKSTKLTAFLLAFMSLTIGLASCEKDDDDPDPTPATIEGLWIGTYSVTQIPSAGLQYYSLIIKPDGTLIADTEGLDEQHFNVGTWTLTGNTFSATTTCVYGLPSSIGTVQTHTATFDKTTGTFTNGVWADVDAPPNISGAFTVTKVK
jgi:hypothetical protein